MPIFNIVFILAICNNLYFLKFVLVIAEPVCILRNITCFITICTPNSKIRYGIHIIVIFY